jgi:hypothetical protein
MAAEEIMAAKENSVKRYVVRLSADEREQLEALIRKGKSPAQRLPKARILLKADVSEAGVRIPEKALRSLRPGRCAALGPRWRKFRPTKG